MRRRLQPTPRSASAFSKSATASVGPDTTQARTLLIVAMESSAGSEGRSSASGSRTASMEPAACSCMRRARVATRSSASSREKTPARHAATYSPREWPSSAAGVTPRLIQRRASAYSKTKSAGWVRRVWSSAACAVSSSPDGGYRIARKSRPSRGRSSSAQRFTSARKTGSCSWSPRPMFTFCAPWPVKRNATRPSSCATGAAVVAVGAHARNAATASGRSRATTARRWANSRRPAWSVQATSARARSGFSRSHAARFAVARSSASGVFAESGNTCAARETRGAGSGGACSRTTCTLVPPMPMELTPARRGAAASGQSIRRLAT